MTSIFNDNDFIMDIIDNNDNDLTDTMHSVIDELVSSFSNERNIDMINHCAGGIYEAYEMYLDMYGELPRQDKRMFYAKLAYVSMYNYYYPKVLDMFNDDDDNTHDTDDDDDNDALSSTSTVEKFE